jgi:DNA-binding SARP family transcriptional activator
MAVVENGIESDPMLLEEHAPARVAAPLRLSVLRGFEVRSGLDVIALPFNGQRLVAYLAVRERPQLRATVASSLWLETTDARASANLRTALWKIRQLRDGLVQTTGNYLSLDAEADVDLARLLAQARRLISPSAELDPSDADAEALSGDLLPDWDEEWIPFERERLRQLRVHALEALCRRLSQAGRHGEAIDAGQAAVAAEPLRESGQRTLIAAHLAEGNLCEARRQFGLYREVLWESLRLAPSEDLLAMLTPNVTRAATMR